MAKKNKPVEPSELPYPGKRPEIDPDKIPENPVSPEEEPDIIPEEEPFESPPEELPAPVESP